MKRLMSRGARRIFQLSPCFRKGESGKKHLEEFTMLEWYRADADYLQLMADCQDLLRFVVADLSAQERFGTLLAHSCLQKLKLDEQWERISVEDAFLAFSPMPAGEALSAGHV